MADQLKPSPYSKSHIYISLFIFLIVFSFCLGSILNKQQLGFLHGMSEEYFSVAYKLHTTGSMYEDSAVDAHVFRPPGYIYFIAGVLRARGISPRPQIPFSNATEAMEYVRYVDSQIYMAQAFLLGLSAVILFLWISRYTGLWTAGLMALSYGLNPYTVILVGLMHYATLHVFCVLVSGYLLTLAVAGPDRHPAKDFLAGILWGLTTLIRPLTLILPFFAGIVYFIRSGGCARRAIGGWLTFCLGMGIAISPYTARNFVMTNQFVPVNAQSGVALWAATSRQTQPAANYYNWWNLWYGEGIKLYGRILPKTPYSAHNYIHHCLTIEREFRREALLNWRRQPEVFFKNMARNTVSFNTDINSVFIKIFQRLQKRPPPDDIFPWLVLNSSQDFYSPIASNAFHSLIVLLQVLGFIGIVIALLKKDQRMLVPVLLYGCFCLAHAVTYMDLMYYYIKVPFLFLFAAYSLGRLQTVPVELRRLGIPKRISAATLSCLCLLLSVLIINLIVFLQ